MWKTRNELPGLIKLDIKYHIGMLWRDVEDYLLKDLKDSIWARDPKIFVKKKNTLINKKYLPKYTLSSKLKIQQDIKEAVLSANLIIIAIPSKDFRKISSKISKYLNNQKILIATKGIENESFMTMF